MEFLSLKQYLTSFASTLKKKKKRQTEWVCVSQYHPTISEKSRYKPWNVVNFKSRYCSINMIWSQISERKQKVEASDGKTFYWFHFILVLRNRFFLLLLLHISFAYLPRIQMNCMFGQTNCSIIVYTKLFHRVFYVPSHLGTLLNSMNYFGKQTEQ